MKVGMPQIRLRMMPCRATIAALRRHQKPTRVTQRVFGLQTAGGVTQLRFLVSLHQRAFQLVTSADGGCWPVDVRLKRGPGKTSPSSSAHHPETNALRYQRIARRWTRCQFPRNLPPQPHGTHAEVEPPETPAVSAPEYIDPQASTRRGFLRNPWSRGRVPPLPAPHRRTGVPPIWQPA